VDLSRPGVTLDLLRLLVGQWMACPELEFRSSGRGWSGFRFRDDLIIPTDGGEVLIGLVAYGGEQQRGIAYVSIQGVGCSRIRGWRAVRETLEHLGARIKRADVAFDDEQGVMSVEAWADEYKAGGFNCGGRMPSNDLKGDWLVHNGAGRTLYVGKRENGKMIRCYEKGKQLGDPASPWVRVELELRAQDRSIPYEILTEPHLYFKGACSALMRFLERAAQIYAMSKTVNTIKREGSIVLGHLVKHARIAYGRLVDLLLEREGGDVGVVIERLRRSGRPKRWSNLLASGRPRGHGILDLPVPA
jgi:phage replication initiation protein